MNVLENNDSRPGGVGANFFQHCGRNVRISLKVRILGLVRAAASFLETNDWIMSVSLK